MKHKHGIRHMWISIHAHSRQMAIVSLKCHCICCMHTTFHKTDINATYFRSSPKDTNRFTILVDISSNKRIQGHALRSLLLRNIQYSQHLGDYKVYDDGSFAFRSITGKSPRENPCPISFEHLRNCVHCVKPFPTHKCVA